eukprot:CAMPEP_0197024374 /NCGR_PEP_ID=MMETSP1384-20130603/4922_1 /TAXON_ID=29189 /ORGANISM="Ammonia sp." /LENGTH=183 /DNA_ID=CAMNT_0042452743 /DNA_START=38 /DNA_END=589 /DNA_ORIENTATION=+
MAAASTPQTQLIIALSFITTFFCLKIFFGNSKAAGSNRKLSPEDKIAFGVDDGTTGHDLEAGLLANAPDAAGNDDKQSAQNQSAPAFSSKDRWSRINANDWENIPWTLFIFWACAIVGHKLSTQIVFYTSILYTVFRLGHTICYANGINPKGVPIRSLFYALGQLTAVISAVMLPVGALIQYG